ncbi:MAG TPA: hypothetical protein VGL53_07930 [Bryobacteraceae bacterium]|jgi:hypothetical protein
MSGSVPMIYPNAITDIKGLEDRPVYFVKMDRSPEWNLVVKMDAKNREADTSDDVAVSIKWGSKLMKHVNSREVNVKVMTPVEVEAFKAAARQKFPPHSIQYMNLSNIGPVFVKMPFVRGLTDADMWDSKTQSADPQLIKANIPKFMDDTVWTELGKVVAVDLFIGNNDRFDSAGKWINHGNVMFVGPTNRVIGLDTFDYNSHDKSNLKTGGGFDELRILIDAGRRNTFARACVESVGKGFEGRMAKNGLGHITLRSDGPNGMVLTQLKATEMPTLYMEYVPNFEEGLRVGADELRRTLQDKVRKYAAAQVQQPKTPWVSPYVGQGQQLAQGRPGLLGQARQQAPRQGYMPLAPVEVPQRATKTIPQGILDRMAYLGWNV